jgi:hypothetical protein
MEVGQGSRPSAGGQRSTWIAFAGLGLLVGNEVARVLGISLLAINAVLQVVWFTAAPLWAFLMIILDVVIIHQLMVNWTEEA